MLLSENRYAVSHGLFPSLSRSGALENRDLAMNEVVNETRIEIFRIQIRMCAPPGTVLSRLPVSRFCDREGETCTSHV